MKLIPLSVTMLLASGLLLADDGALQSKDVSKTPDWDTEHASLQQLWFYVPAQQSDFTLVGESDDFPGIEYCVATDPADPDNCTLLATRYQARPLVAFYEDGPVEMPADAGGFYGHGERDMYGALSLDDGATWRRTNLSKSADKSSIKIKLDGRKKIAYPGDVFRNFTTASGNKVLAVWASRYCGGGNPNYALDSDYIDILTGGGDTPFMDLFGSQTTDCTGVRPDDPTKTLLMKRWKTASTSETPGVSPVRRASRILPRKVMQPLARCLMPACGRPAVRWSPSTKMAFITPKASTRPLSGEPRND